MFNKAIILHHWLDTFIKSEQISEVMEKEFEELIKWFYSIEEITLKYFGSDF